MKRTSNMRLILAFFFAFCTFGSWGQLVQVPLVKNLRAHTRSNSNKRVEQLSAMRLPFWDDFSFNNPHHKDSLANYPYDSLWQYGRSIWGNTGMGINPPTIKVATFDGIDSVGLPYNINTSLANGGADKLISRPKLMDVVYPSPRDSCLSFF